MTKTARLDAIARFRSGELTVLTNVFVLTEGFDVPRAKCCIIARGCASTGAWLQMGGRVFRPFEGMRAIVYDARGSIHKHGFFDELRVFGLDNTPISGGTGPTRTCPQCRLIMRGSIASCTRCGFVFPLARKKPDRAKVTKLEQGNIERTYWVETLNTAIAKGYKDGWAAMRFKMRFGRFPAKFWRERQRQLDAAQARENSVVADAEIPLVSTSPGGATTNANDEGDDEEIIA